MRLIFLTSVIILVRTSANAQVVEPPTEADEFGWLRWAVIVLLGVLVTGATSFIAFIKTSHEARLEDRDEEITRLTSQLQEEQRRNDRIQSEKDALYKEIQDKVVPAITTATNLIQNFLNK